MAFPIERKAYAAMFGPTTGGKAGIHIIRSDSCCDHLPLADN